MNDLPAAVVLAGLCAVIGGTVLVAALRGRDGAEPVALVLFPLRAPRSPQPHRRWQTGEVPE